MLTRTKFPRGSYRGVVLIENDSACFGAYYIQYYGKMHPVHHLEIPSSLHHTRNLIYCKTLSIQMIDGRIGIFHQLIRCF